MIQFLDALAFFFLIGMSIIGFRRGLVEELGRLLGLVIATFFSLKLYVGLGSLLLNWIPMDIWVLFILSFILIFSIILISMRIITRLIQFLFLSKSTKWVNRLMGTFFGGSKGILVVMMFFWIFELIPNSQSANIILKESEMAQYLIKTRKSIISSFNLDDPIKSGEESIKNYLISIEKNNG